MKNRVDPSLLPGLEMFQDIDLKPEFLPSIREGLDQMYSPLPQDDSLSIYNETIAGPDGDPLQLRIYQPADRDDELPALLWIHGGGYVLGTVESNDASCAEFVKEAGCVVVSVDYRLAPEHPYPAPLEDCYTALKWVAENVETLNIDGDRIGVAGASAGGGLTAALTLLARDRGYPSVHFQMPLYPMIDDRNNTPSAEEIKEGMVWNQKTNEDGWKMYLGSLHGTDKVPSYAAPARETDYSRLPSTYTCVGQLDPFRSETMTYVTKLAEACVDVEFHLFPGAYHGFEGFNPDAEIAVRAKAGYIQALKRGLHSQTRARS